VNSEVAVPGLDKRLIFTSHPECLKRFGVKEDQSPDAVHNQLESVFTLSGIRNRTTNVVGDPEVALTTTSRFGRTWRLLDDVIDLGAAKQSGSFILRVVPEPPRAQEICYVPRSRTGVLLSGQCRRPLQRRRHVLIL
jgi:hypothetical protein